MKRRRALLRSMRSFVLSRAYSVGVAAVTGVVFYESLIKPLIHGLGG